MQHTTIQPMEANPRVQDMLDVIRQYIEDQGWQADEHADESGARSFRLGFTMRNGPLKVYFEMDGDGDRFGIYVYPSFNVPEEHRGKAAEYIARVNYCQYLGKLELDLEEGGVRMTATADVTGSRLSPEMLDVMENVAIIGMNRYLAGILAIVYGGRSPKEAHEAIRNDDEEESAEPEALRNSERGERPRMVH